MTPTPTHTAVQRFLPSFDGRRIFDNDFTHDALLNVDGDFGDDKTRRAYAKRLCDALNAALASLQGERQDSRPVNGAPCGQPLAGPNSKEGLVDPVVPTPEPHGAPLPPGAASQPQARPLSEWEEDMGSVLWWRFPVEEPPYCGTPNCNDWPGYHTHWTPLVVPSDPALVGESSSERGAA